MKFDYFCGRVCGVGRRFDLGVGTWTCAADKNAENLSLTEQLFDAHTLGGRLWVSW